MPEERTVKGLGLTSAKENLSPVKASPSRGSMTDLKQKYRPIPYWLAWILARLGIMLVPAIPEIHRHKLIVRLGESTFTLRMYAVGFLDRISRNLIGKPAVCPSSNSILSILSVLGIGRLKIVVRFFHPDLIPCITESHSQMGQETLAVVLCDGPDPKFFVEAGACDGKFSSNTWLLERQYGWAGILCEPGCIWHEALTENRDCRVDKRALWSTSGEEVIFRQTRQPSLSTIDAFTYGDDHALKRSENIAYAVETVSLIDLLDQGNAPKYIDLLSLDTEGSEYEILRDFPFERYEFGLITCEHNNTSAEQRIHQLLEENGYVYLESMSRISLGDAWFVGPKLRDRLNSRHVGARLFSRREAKR